MHNGWGRWEEDQGEAAGHVERGGGVGGGGGGGGGGGEGKGGDRGEEVREDGMGGEQRGREAPADRWRQAQVNIYVR